MSPAYTVRQMALGYIVSRSIYVAAELGIADLLKDGPKSANNLADMTGTNAGILYRLLRILAGEGVFKEGPDGTFSLTPMSEALRTDVPDSVHAYVLMKHELEFPPLMDIMHTVQQGEPAFIETFGSSVFDYLKENPGPAARFQAAMAAGHGKEDEEIADAFDFSQVNHVVDVGGGNGSLLSALLRRYDHLKATLFELEPAITAAQSGAGGPLPGCDLIVGNFLEDVTPGGDIYILKKVVHNWSEEEAITILRNCRRAMNEGGKVLIIETLVGQPNEPTWGKMQDFTMLLVFKGGMERTTDEYAELLSKAELRLDHVQEISPETAIVVAEAA